MTRILLALWLIAVCAAAHAANPLHGLMERLSPGLSDKIGVEIEPEGSTDWFSLSQGADGRPLIRANSYLSAAVGLNRYLCDFCSARPGWMQPNIELPQQLPAVAGTLTSRCKADLRYYLNYCTYSYSMAFWNRERWQQEIDWMALHGINMPLAAEGTAAVWRNTLRRLGYPDEAISRFVAGPAYQAWWLMNNLEGWGGPVPDNYYEQSAQLQKWILTEMRSWGIEPVLPGYSGMIPHDATTALGISTADPGLWLGFNRPAFINPTSPDFRRVAEIYYDEQARLYGTAHFYSMDPFHEGGSTEGLDMRLCGRAIYNAMERHAPGSVWVLQGWGGNPNAQMISGIPSKATMILDLQAESIPMWQVRDEIFDTRPWIYCMLLNFGGNEGLYGKAKAMIAGYENALAQSSTLCGIGLTMEAIGNNPVMYDLITELPWMPACNLDEWLEGYVRSAYGEATPAAMQAWRLLINSVYDSPAELPQQGTTESVFCSRPADNPRQASTWADVKEYYNPRDVIKAATLLLDGGEGTASREAYRYDAVNTVRQAVAECGRLLINRIDSVRGSGDSLLYRRMANDFLSLIDIQDSITAMHPALRLDTWLNQAESAAPAPADTALWRENALRLITTWGPRTASDTGGLHDYSHREWSGLLGSLYRKRWKRWFDARSAEMQSPQPPQIDYFAIEDAWVKSPTVTTPPADFSLSRLRRLLGRAIEIVRADGVR